MHKNIHIYAVYYDYILAENLGAAAIIWQKMFVEQDRDTQSS